MGMIKKPLQQSINLISESLLKETAGLTIPTQKVESQVQVGKEFNIPRDEYRKHLLSSQAGEVREVSLNSSKLFLLSQYGAGLNLYKMLNFVRPDAICMQVRADDIFSKGFRLDVSASEFQDHIRRAGAELMPSATHYYNTTLVLKKRKILHESIKLAKIKQVPYSLVDRVHDYTVAYAARWGLHRRFENYYVCDLPREAFTRRIMGEMTLLQVQNMLVETCRMLCENPDIILPHEPRSPLTAAYKIYPDQLVSPSDRFIARFLRSLDGAHKRIFVILGNGQCDTLPLFLDSMKDNPPSLESMLQPEWKYQGFISSETTESAVEKRAIIDLCTFGLDLISHITTHKALRRTAAFIDAAVARDNVDESYTLPLKERKERTDMLNLLYLSSLQKYKSIGLQEMAKGRDTLKAQFMVAFTG